jgi:hypothetical protein
MTSTLLALALNYVGAAALALAMDRHQRQVGGRTARHVLGWRLLGGTAWGASLLLCCLSSGWGVGVVQWLGVLTVACLLVMAVLAFWPRCLLGGVMLTRRAGRR